MSTLLAPPPAPHTLSCFPPGSPRNARTTSATFSSALGSATLKKTEGMVGVYWVGGGFRMGLGAAKPPACRAGG